MRLNRGSKRGLIWVHVSSIVKWGYQEVIFHAHKKHQHIKQTTLTVLEVCVHSKLLPLLFSVSLFLFCWFIFACDVFLWARNLFVKKKDIMSRLEIALITSFCCTTCAVFWTRALLRHERQVEHKFWYYHL